MNDILSLYYFTHPEVLALLILLGAVWAAVFCVKRKDWRHRLETLEQALSDAQTRYDKEHFRVLHDHLQRTIAHDFTTGLRYISDRSQETVAELGQDELELRDKQHRIIAKAAEITRRAENVTHLLTPEPDAGPRELLNTRRLVESVSLELHSLADAEGVTLRHDLRDVEPVTFHRDSALVALRNVIGNAIKYTCPGGVVTITLFLRNPAEDAGTRLCVDVKDDGKGIPEDEQDKIFELNVRGDGLIEPGSGLGLYVGREAMRRHGGDLALVSSTPNHGSVFRLVFPYISATSESDRGA